MLQVWNRREHCKAIKPYFSTCFCTLLEPNEQNEGKELTELASRSIKKNIHAWWDTVARQREKKRGSRKEENPMTRKTCRTEQVTGGYCTSRLMSQKPIWELIKQYLLKQSKKIGWKHSITKAYQTSPWQIDWAHENTPLQVIRPDRLL